jgi:RHS repeat-associated protein
MDSAGHVTQETIGNGIVTNRSFDAVTQWLGTAQSGVGGGAGVKNLAFLYDEMGNVTQRQDNNLGLTENIYYDNDYRFSYSKLNGTQNLSVTYDGTGNITSRSDVASGASWTYDPNRKHEVTQAGSSAYVYSYDANGNAYSRQGSTISWSSYNYPTTVNAGSGSTAETVAFSYGPDRQRWQQMYTGNSTQETTNYIGGLLEVVAGGSVTDYRHYINVAGEQVAVYSRKNSGTNTFSYLLSDHQGSVASITNSSGAQVVGESFAAFGSRRNPTTWSGAPSNSDLTTIAGITREGYTFQTALGLWMGMNHMNGRVEDSITGRMLSADPTIPDSNYSQSYNLYSYVNNNPLSFADPSGFTPCGFKCKPVNALCAVNWIQCGEIGNIGTGAYAYAQFVASLNALSGNDDVNTFSDPNATKVPEDPWDNTPQDPLYRFSSPDDLSQYFKNPLWQGTLNAFLGISPKSANDGAALFMPPLSELTGVPGPPTDPSKAKVPLPFEGPGISLSVAPPKITKCPLVKEGVLNADDRCKP